MIVKQLFKIIMLFLITNKRATTFSKYLESENKIKNDEKVNDSESKNFTEFRAHYADKMMSLMNYSVDPCDDFYEYACGNYKQVYVKRQTQELPPAHLTDIEYKFNDIVEQLLYQPPKNLANDYADELQIAHQFYNTCLTADLYPIKKSQTYLEVLKSIGGFPAADNTWQATADNFSWFNMSAHLRRFGATGLIKEYMAESYPYMLFLERPELGFDYKIKRKTKNVIHSRANAVNEKRMRQLLKPYKLEAANITEIVANIYELWESILNIEEEADEILNDCQKQWNIYLAIAWNGQNFTLENYCSLYKKLNAICEVRKEAVANYLALQFLHHMYARLDDKQFLKEMCLYKLRKGFSYLFDKLYFSEYFTKKVTDELASIITEIRKSLSSLIQQSDWLDENTQNAILLKQSEIVLHLIYNEEDVLKERLIREMKNLSFVGANFDWNNMELMKFGNFLNRFYTLHSDQLENTTLRFALLVAMVADAEYSPFDNSITIFPGLLHTPVYHKAWPYALKFGAFGYFIGHELMHAFDPAAVEFDHSDESNHLWPEESYNEFNRRVECYIQHFNSYLVTEINRTIDGFATRNENIADSVGLRISFNAYRNYLKDLDAALYLKEQMPGMKLSPEQLFFIGYAQVWCTAYEKEHYWLWLDNEHTINKYRVLGALTNYDEFSQMYNCPLGSKMNPKLDKCRIW